MQIGQVPIFTLVDFTLVSLFTFLFIMATYRAKCWLGSSSGYQDLEVKANTVNGAKEQFERIYGAEQVINLSEVRDGGSSSGGGSGVSIGGTAGLISLIAAAWVFFTFTPWILMGLGGVVGAWLSEKVLGQTLGDYVNDASPTKSNHIRAILVLLTTISLGGVGFYQGDQLNKSFNEPSKTEQIKK